MSPAAEPAPNLNIPDSNSTVNVWIINSTARIKGIPTEVFLEPHITGFDVIDCPAYSFLIEHLPTGRKVLLDLGVRKDWENLAPRIVKRIKDGGWSVNVDKGVADILREGGVKPEEIESIIWSHYHWDHTGDPSTFPSTTSLVVGPGFEEHLKPGYPAKDDAPIRESDYEGREVKEIDFETTDLRLGQFRAMDFFGDGSFYLLDAPGHAVGHMCALCRTSSSTSPSTSDTFMFLGGDCAHHASEWRPTEYLPLPDDIRPSPLPALCPTTCPGSMFTSIHRFHDESSASLENEAAAMTYPFCTPSDDAAYNGAEARESTEHMSEFDADENILVMIAHDNTMLEVVDFFPDLANDWKNKGWKERGLWKFLGDFHKAVKGKVEDQSISEFRRAEEIGSQ